MVMEPKIYNTDPIIVSVIVISFNSSKTILATLDSIKNQTYAYIELIISDDCSKDNTLEICSEWINENKKRFVRTSIMKSAQNTGIAGNCNRGCRAASGAWLKIIAADDILMPNCVEDNVYCCMSNSEISILFSEVVFFAKNDKEISKKKRSTFSLRDFWNKSARGQYLELLYCNFLPAPSSFLLRSLIEANPFDENFPFMEDYPLWISLTKKGIKLSFMDKATVMYRIEDSTTHTKDKIFSPLYRDTYCKFFWSVLNQAVKEEGLQDAYNYQRKILFMYDISSFLFKNKTSKIKAIVIKIIASLVNRCRKLNFQQ